MNGPTTFQRYINHTLREYLDEFVSACHGHDDKACWILMKQDSALVFVQY